MSSSWQGCAAPAGAVRAYTSAAPCSNATGIVVGAGGFHHTNAPGDYTQVVNDIVFDNRRGIAEQGTTGPHNSYRNNLVSGNPDGDRHLADGMPHTGTVPAEPQFAGYTRDGPPDFRLTAESPAIG